MSQRRKVGGGLFAVVLTGSLLSGIGPVSGAYAQEAPDAVRNLSSVEVTLITGDKVQVNSDGTVASSRLDAGRKGILNSYQLDGRTYVMPTDAVALVAAGKLDRRLFDVTALAEAGAAKRGEVPLIVKYGRNAKTTVGTSLTRAGAKSGRDLSSVGAVSVRAPSTKAGALWKQLTTGSGINTKLRPEYLGVYLDAVYKPTLDQSVPQVGAPTAWAAGYTGTGVKVAVLDSGIDATHPDLSGKVIAAQNFTSEPNTNDMYGHGTHVASIVAGSGAASSGLYKGVAGGASLLNGKVCVAANNGQCFESDIIEGMEWAAAQGADIVNLSLGGPDMEGVDPLEEAINTLTASHGVLFVVSSGNSGFAQDFSVSSPSTADAALSVGAVDGGDNLAFFSNRGPRRGDTALKPDMTAPGVTIRAARSSTGILGDSADQYVDLSGTSMAAPHVAGAAAILLQRRPTWTAAQLKSALMGSSVANPSLSAFQQGAGRLDIARGYNQTVLASPPSVSLGRQLWPHGDDPVLNRTVTYTNNGTSSVTLNLALSTRDPFGSTAPAGMFAISASSLTIAAGGTGSVTLTATTSVAGPDGFYSGEILATATGGIQTRTPFAVDRSTEGYEVTITNIDRTGSSAPGGGYLTQLFPLTPGNPVYTYTGAAGADTKFIQKGSYLVLAQIMEAGGSTISVMTRGKLQVTANRSLTFDARTAGVVAVDVTDDSLDQVYYHELVFLSQDTQFFSLSGAYEGLTVYTGQDDPSIWEPNFKSKVVVRRARPGPTGTFHNSPRSYSLGKFYHQNMTAGWTQNFTSSGLARVDAQMGVHVPGAILNTGAHLIPGSGVSIGGWLKYLGFDGPFTHQQYFNTGSDIRWRPQFLEEVVDGGSIVSTFGSLNNYTAGTTTTEVWNKPVFGPAHALTAESYNWITRQGNVISPNVQLVGDGYGHPGVPNMLTSGQMLLFRNGVQVFSTEYPPPFGVPAVTVAPGFATYRLEATMERGAPVVLGTRISAAWTFNSDTTGGPNPVRLPIWSLSYLPALNAANTAPANTTFNIPVSIGVQPNSTASGLNTVSVQYSTNDGATWTNATLTGSGMSRTATVTHPNTTGFVSLKATVTDFSGNSVEQTTIRAYKIAP